MRPATQRRGHRVCIDFDGVIHDYREGFKDGSIYGDPVPRAFQTMQALFDKGYDICVLTTRGADENLRLAVVEWMRKLMMGLDGVPLYDFEFEVTHEKRPAIAYIDDRAVRFTNWDDVGKYWL